MSNKQQNIREVRNFATFQARVYPAIAVPIILIWLTIGGYINAWVAVILWPILTTGLEFLCAPLIDALIPRPVSVGGCGLGQFLYWISPLILVLFYWQGGTDLLFVGTIAIPFLVIGFAIVMSRFVR